MDKSCFGCNNCIGPTGARGPQGHKGPPGIRGSDGSMGIRGFTGPRGCKGKDGRNGKCGRDGRPGKPGCRGPTGDIGPTGCPGRRGEIGPKGRCGRPGCTGPRGHTGDMGPTGEKGETGEMGPTGCCGGSIVCMCIYSGSTQPSSADKVGTTGSVVGELCLALDDGDVFQWDGSAWEHLTPHPEFPFLFIDTDTNITYEATTLGQPVNAINCANYCLVLNPKDCKIYECVDGNLEEKCTLSCGESGITGPTGEQGIQGPTGDVGPTGETGMIGPTGEQGIQGMTGPPSDNCSCSLECLCIFTGATQESSSDKPGNPGSVVGEYCLAIDDSDLFQWDGTTWEHVVPQPTTPYLYIDSSTSDIYRITQLGDPATLVQCEDVGTVLNEKDGYLYGCEDGNLVQKCLLMGPTGEQGIQGPTGEQGMTGPTGEMGAQGIQGPTGEVGVTGPQGLIGPTGDTGGVGMTGSTGPTGASGIDGPASEIHSVIPQIVDGSTTSLAIPNSLLIKTHPHSGIITSVDTSSGNPHVIVASITFDGGLTNASGNLTITETGGNAFIVTGSFLSAPDRLEFDLGGSFTYPPTGFAMLHATYT